MNNRYPNQDNSKIKCRIISGSLYQYEAEGICHEKVIVTLEQEFRDESSFELEKGNWYELGGEIKRKNNEISIDINSASQIKDLGEKINDWLGTRNLNPEVKPGRPNPQPHSGSGGIAGRIKRFASMGSSHMESANPSAKKLRDAATMSKEQDISGFATGGNKDADNFRKNIRNGFLPHPDSLNYEGVFYDYEFEISGDEKESMFYPVYEHAYFSDPISDEKEDYLAVGLESGANSFERPPIDLMLSVDVSGSMSNELTEYYYDEYAEKDIEESGKTKMEATIEVIKKIVESLEEDDRLGVVLYNNKGIISKPLRKTCNTDLDSIKEEIQEIRAGGGTDLSDGFNAAVEEYIDNAEIETSDQDRESRIMFLTDAMPNSGTTNRKNICDMIENAAEKHSIHTTFIGIGVDANPDLIESLSSIRGSNSYFVDNTQEFIKRVGEEFTLMSIPLVFNLELKLEGNDYSIKDVFGNPNNGEKESIMKVKTLFPSTGEEGTKGGVILISLNEVNEDSEIRISATWEDRYGNKNADVRTVEIDSERSDYFDSNSIEKAIVIKKYVDVLRDWMESKQELRDYEGEWEQKSIDKEVSDKYQERMKTIRELLENKIQNKGMDELVKERDVIDQIIEK